MKRLMATVMCAFLLFGFIPTARAADAPISIPLEAVKYGAAAADVGIGFCAEAEWDGESTYTLTVERAYSAFKPWYGDTASREKSVSLSVPVLLDGCVGGEVVRVGDLPYVVGALGERGNGLTLTVKLAKGGNKYDYYIAHADGEIITLSVDYIDLDTLKRFSTAAQGVNEPYFLARMSQDNAVLTFDTALKNGIGGLKETARTEDGRPVYALEAALYPLNSSGKPLGEGYTVKLSPETGSRSAIAIFDCDDEGIITLGQDGAMRVTLSIADDNKVVSPDDDRYISLTALRKAETLAVGKWRIAALNDAGETVFEKTLSLSVNALSRLNAPMISIDKGNFLSIEEGEVINLKAGVNGTSSAKTVEWSSSNAALATVTQDGTLTAIAPGVVYVKAAIPSVGAEALVTVTITALNVPVKHVVTHRNINLREKPGTDAASLGTVSRGDILFVVSQSDGWVKVEFEASATGYAYISERYLVPVE